jgi:broad specificity phosphatase PhoE
VHDADYSQTWTQFSQRCQAGLAQVVREADAARDIWIFTSGGTISAMLQPLLGIGDDRIFDLNWALFNTGVTKLLFSGERISVSYINSYAHLEQRRRSELLTYR